MRPLWRRDMRFLPCFSNDSLISTWIVAIIGGGNVGGDTAAAGAGARDDDDDDVERDFLRRMTGVGLLEPSSTSASDSASSSSKISGTRGGRARRLAWGEAPGFSTGRRAFGRVSFLGDGDFGEGMLKFLRMEPKLLIKLWT